jgi:hypothetical protein
LIRFITLIVLGLNGDEMQVPVSLSILILAITLFSFSAFTPVQAAITWNTQTVDENGAFIDGHCPIIVDSNNTVHIVYSAIYNSTCWVMYATWNGSGFNIEIVTKGDGAYSLVLDADGNPHILYGIWGKTHSLLIAEWNGRTWEIQSTPIDNANGGTLVLDSYGNPHIAYMIDGKVQYASCTGTVWNVQTVGIIVDSSGFSLALDTNNTPYILYSPSSYIDIDQNTEVRAINIKLATYRNSDWDIQTVSLPPIIGHFGNIVLDSIGYPHFICAQDFFVSSENMTLLSTLFYVSWNGTDWNTEEIAKDIEVEEIGQLILNSQDNPVFCFIDEGKFSYGQYSQGIWDIQTSNIGALGPCYVALDSTGTQHISYRAWGGRFIAPVMYAMPKDTQNEPSSYPENNLLVLIITVAVIAAVAAIVIVCIRRSNSK